MNDLYLLKCSYVTNVVKKKLQFNKLLLSLRTEKNEGKSNAA
jgi:hypothetical protein